MLNIDSKNKDTTRMFLCSLVLSMVYSIFSVFGYQLEKYENIDFLSGAMYIQIIILTVLFTLIIISIFKIMNRLKIGSKEYVNGAKIYWFTVAFFLVCWLPALIGCYPGLFNYDADGQLIMYLNRQITAHHPPLHTWLMGSIIELGLNITGSIYKGVFLFCCFQLFIFACCFSYIIQYIRTKKCPCYIVIAACCWFAFFPTVVINILSITKDNFFAAFLVVFMTMTLQILEEPQKYLYNSKFMFAWAVITVLTAIMRNNAIYVIALFLPILFIILKKYWKKVLIVYIGIVFLYGLYIGVFCSLVVTEGVNSKELMSVPTQQLVRVYKEKEMELSEAEKEIYDILFDDVAIEYYNPKISDVVKSNYNTEEFDRNHKKYVQFYIEMGKKYPEIYVNSFLHNTYGFWYPKAKLILSASGQEGYFACQSHTYVGNKSPSMIPFIWDYLQLFGDSDLVYGDSITVVLFAPASFLWVALFVMAYLSWKRKKNEMIIMSVMLMIWLTFLFGPVALVRYVAFLFFVIPLEVSFLFGGKKENAV